MPRIALALGDRARKRGEFTMILVRSSLLLRPARSVVPGDLSQVRTLPGAVHFQSSFTRRRERNEMSWRCHGRDNAELVANLQSEFLHMPFICFTPHVHDELEVSWKGECGACGKDAK
ncbi:hypothetical protein R1sor_000636 [Riccia sorocarpa]|uniref:Uncharacterized protein n=1 Tax=Riccia sorocarpa TaxID=122646 RepID=A0ABD3GXN4_9MARC